jgi:hypothetical protein
MCKREMTLASSCTPWILHAAGVVHPMVRFGDETRFGADHVAGARCHDCGVRVGAWHHLECDWAECPLCHGQLLGCGCQFDEGAEPGPALFLRAFMASGATWPDPSEDLLFELLSDIERGSESFIIVERSDDATGQTFFQAIIEDGVWRVERREGAPERHFFGFVPDTRAAHATLTAWAFGQGPVTAEPRWQPLEHDG